jgi:hypothetical protein
MVNSEEKSLKRFPIYIVNLTGIIAFLLFNNENFGKPYTEDERNDLYHESVTRLYEYRILFYRWRTTRLQFNDSINFFVSFS